MKEEEVGRNEKGSSTIRGTKRADDEDEEANIKKRGLKSLIIKRHGLREI